MMDRDCKTLLTSQGHETLRSMNALPEMNMTNLAKLPIALQIKWRDKALQIRESRIPQSQGLSGFH